MLPGHVDSALTSCSHQSTCQGCGAHAKAVQGQSRPRSPPNYAWNGWNEANWLGWIRWMSLHWEGTDMKQYETDGNSKLSYMLYINNYMEMIVEITKDIERPWLCSGCLGSAKWPGYQYVKGNSKATNMHRAGLLRTGKVPLAYHSRAHAPLPQRWPRDKSVWFTSAILGNTGWIITKPVLLDIVNIAKLLNSKVQQIRTSLAFARSDLQEIAALKPASGIYLEDSDFNIFNIFNISTVSILSKAQWP